MQRLLLTVLSGFLVFSNIATADDFEIPDYGSNYAYEYQNIKQELNRSPDMENDEAPSFVPNRASLEFDFSGMMKHPDEEMTPELPLD